MAVAESSEAAPDSVAVAVEVDEELFESPGLDESIGVPSSVVEVEVAELSVAVTLSLVLSVGLLSSLAV